jgi:hypothetical protein
MVYLTYIDPFTYAIFWLVFWLIFVIALVYWLAKWFAWFINEVMELKETNKYDKNK